MRDKPLTFALISVLFITGCAEWQAGASSPPLGPAYATISHSNYVPAGSTVVIRMREAVQAADPAPGRFFSAEFAEPVLNQRGDVLIPRGSLAIIDVVQVPGGRDLALAVRSVEVDGERYIARAIDDAEPLTDEESAIVHRRGRMMKGGGALLGTLVETAADGSEAAAGQESGANPSVAGEKIDVPASTVLNFRLDSAMMLQGFGE